MTMKIDSYVVPSNVEQALHETFGDEITINNVLCWLIERESERLEVEAEIANQLENDPHNNGGMKS